MQGRATSLQELAKTGAEQCCSHTLGSQRAPRSGRGSRQAPRVLYLRSILEVRKLAERSSGGEGEPPEHFNKPPHLILQPEFHAAVNRGCVRVRQMARAAPIRCSPPLPRPSSIPPWPPSSTLLSPPSATISHWLWGDGVDCRHWPCPLVGRHPAWSLLSPPHPSSARMDLCPQAPRATLGRGGSGHRVAGVERLVGKASQALII